MAQITINIPNNVLDRTIGAICALNNYQDTINIGKGIEPEIVPNPQTRQQFAKQWIIGQIKQQVKHHESQLAAESAKIAAEQQTDTDIVLT